MARERVLVTVSREGPELETKATQFAALVGGVFQPREKKSLNRLREEHEADLIVIVRRDQISISDGYREFFYHPNMAGLRLERLCCNEPDRLVTVAGLMKGDRFLDCTLGLGSDAVVASFVVGSEGEVTALESNLLIAAVVREGLSTYNRGDPELIQAMRRVKVIHTDHLEYLRKVPDRFFDIVYFDPMFRVPGRKSISMDPLRLLADSRPLEPEAIKEACRVARRKVVLKEKTGSREFERLGFKTVQGSRFSPVAYGVIVTGVEDFGGTGGYSRPHRCGQIGDWCPGC